MQPIEINKHQFFKIELLEVPLSNLLDRLLKKPCNRSNGLQKIVILLSLIKSVRDFV